MPLPTDQLCRRPRDRSLRALLALFALLPVTTAEADQVLRTRLVQPNGRPVQEVRLGEMPGSNLLRAVVVTNGPTAGTTSLLTAVGTADQWLDSATIAPTWTTLIASGTVFSVGGGCRRGDHVDFPFINNNRPNVLRFTAAGSTIIPALTPDPADFDSAECRAAPDGSRTSFLFTNRSTGRLPIVLDRGGPNDLNVPLVTFSSVKTPFMGGLRPQMSLLAGNPVSFAMMHMETSGQTRWRQYNTETINIDFNCLVGTQTPPPSAFTIPRGSRVVGKLVLGDFDGNLQFEYGVITTDSAVEGLGNCTAGPVLSPAGPVAGTGFSWTEPTATVGRNLGITSVIYGRKTVWDGDSAPTVNPGPHPNVAGTFGACGYENTETQDGDVSVAVENSTFLRYIQELRSGGVAVTVLPFKSSMEGPESVTSWLCDERALQY